MLNTIRVAVIDDHPLLREGVVHTLKREKAIDVVGEGGSADEALEIASRKQPNVMLLDVNMPGGGIEAARMIMRTHPEVKTVMLTVSEREEDVTSAITAGAKGYVLKGVSGAELTRMVRAVYGGDTYLTPVLASRLFAMLQNQVGASKVVKDRHSDLTAREEQILTHVSLGLSNKEVGRKLNLSEKTVKHYMTNVLQKLQVRNRVEAIRAYSRRDGADPAGTH